MNYTLTPPAEGKVVLEMTWQEAEIVTRLVGQANHGNLTTHAPALALFIERMVEQFGRNTTEAANRYIVEVRGSQGYIEDLS